MVGLSASELQAETLFPGDTIEYYSMAFVAGDKRGHRVSKVLRVDRNDDEFPIRVDTQEMLPLTIMLKRKIDRNDVEISSNDAKWRKLRTFRLVNGEVEGETRADRLNAGLKKGLADAMKATRKLLAKEKEEKANAGSKKLMNSYFVSLDGAAEEGDTTSSQRSSLERISTPERKKKKRKPLTPRQNYESNQTQNKMDSKKNHVEDKSPRNNRSEARPKQKFKYDKPEPRKLKRKRSDSMSTTPKQSGPSQPTISKYFGKKQHRQKKRKSFDVMKFVSHAEEKEEIMPSESRKLIEIEEVKRDKNTDLNSYLDLENKQQAVVKTVKDRSETSSKAGDTRAASNRSDSPRKKAWKQQLSNYRQSNAGSSLVKWLKQPKNGLEEVSNGTPTKPKERGKQRILNPTSDKQYPPKMNRKNIHFLMNNASNAAHRMKEAKKPTRRDDSPSKQDNQLRKKRGSLGTVSARTSKPGEWTSRKHHR